MEAKEAFDSAVEHGEIVVASDWHGQLGWSLYIISLTCEVTLSPVIMQQGDFGAFNTKTGLKNMSSISEALEKADKYLFVSLGNHENYDYIKTLERVPGMGDSRYDPRHPHIIFLERGHRWMWGDLRCISVGGANSIDAEYRTEGLSWWSGEKITAGDIRHATSGGKVDLMFAHDVPWGVDVSGTHRDAKGWQTRHVEYSDRSRHALRKITDVIQPEYYFHGHYHKLMKRETQLLGSEGTYKMKSACLSKDYTSNNVGIFNLETKVLEMLEIPKPIFNIDSQWDSAWWMQDGTYRPWWSPLDEGYQDW